MLVTILFMYQAFISKLVFILKMKSHVICMLTSFSVLTVTNILQWNTLKFIRPECTSCLCNIWFVLVLINLPQTQEETMDELILFIEHYSKYIVSINWQRCVLTLLLSHANCCNPVVAVAPAHYAIESYQTSLKLNPFLMLIIGTLNLLYFIIFYRVRYQHILTKW